MTAIIIEDEIPAAVRLKRLLESKGFVVLVILHSVRDSKIWLSKNLAPDYIFADIQLRDGMCFAIFNSVKIASRIVFTTAFDEFALKAFEFNSLDYLLKPIDAFKLDNLVTKIALVYSSNENLILYSKLEDQIENRYKSSFLVASGDGLKKIFMASVSHFTSENNTTFLISTDGRSYNIETSLEKLKANLCPHNFFRISRKYIMSRESIISISSAGNLKITLKTPLDIKVSRSKLKSFIEWYKK